MYDSASLWAFDEYNTHEKNLHRHHPPKWIKCLLKNMRFPAINSPVFPQVGSNCATPSNRIYSHGVSPSCFFFRCLEKKERNKKHPMEFLPSDPPFGCLHPPSISALAPLATTRWAQRSGCVPWSSAPAGASASASLAPEIRGGG